MTFISDKHQGPCILEAKNTKSLAKKEPHEIEYTMLAYMTLVNTKTILVHLT